MAVDTAGGTPYLELETGETDRRAGYVSASGRDLLFRYTVAENDTAADLDYSGASALALNGGSITDDPAGNAATAASLSLSGLSGQDTLAGSEDLAVDGVRPAVDSVSSPDDDGTYGIGSMINVTVTLDGDVAVDTAGGTPYLELETGETDRRAGYVSASGRDLLFRYTVAENDTAADLDYSGASALALNGGSITDDPAGNAATAASLSLSGLSGQDTLAGSEDLAVDGVRPAVASVSSNATGTYYTNRLIYVHVSFNENVTVAGTPFVEPFVELNARGGAARATYASGSGSETLAFEYHVRDGDDVDRLDYAGEGALRLGDGGAIADRAGNDARLALPYPQGGTTDLAGRNIIVDTSIASVSSVTSPDADGAYAAGAIVNITVHFSEQVRVAGETPPFIELNVDRPGARAVYESGSGSAELEFAYVVRPGDDAGDLGYAPGSEIQPDASITTAAAGPLSIHSCRVPASRDRSAAPRDIVIDTDPPSVVSVSSPNRTGTYAAGDTIHIAVNFSEAVTVAGAPALLLGDGRGGQGRRVRLGLGLAEPRVPVRRRRRRQLGRSELCKLVGPLARRRRLRQGQGKQRLPT